MVSLQTLRTPQRRKRSRRIGRGTGSGRGTYSGRGIKGQKARTGGKSGLKRKGLKQFLHQLPKSRGFKQEKLIMGVNLDALMEHFSEGAHVTPKELAQKGLLRKGFKVKILTGKEKVKKLSISADAFSKKAEAQITQAGGTARRLSSKT